MQQHNDHLYECETCASMEGTQQLCSKFSKRSALLHHMQDHLQQKTIKCDSCSKRFGVIRQLRQHRKHHLVKTVMCPHCPRRFKSETTLQEHYNTHTGSKPFNCGHCNKKFSSRCTLKIHFKTHLVRERNYKCEVCNKDFLSYHHLVEHSHVHQDTRDFICENCGKGFATSRSLELHMVTHTGIKNFACKTCNKQFARKGEVEDHERTHTGEKPFQCEMCGATFSQRSNLQSHRRATHYKEKKHQCSMCNKAFKRKRLLVYHMMSVHTGERPHKCAHCSAAFVYPEHYKKHLRIHTGEKPFKCDRCGKAFNSRDNRNAHKFIHSERKPYECIICNAGFMRKPMLVAHIMQHGSPHNSQPERCIRVNPPSVADEAPLSDSIMSTGERQVSNANVEELYTSGNAMSSLKISQPNDLENAVQLVSGDSMEVVRPLIIDGDHLSRYLLQSNERGQLIASIQGQMVEVRTDGGLNMRTDALHYQFSEGDGSGEIADDSNVDDPAVRQFELEIGSPDEDDGAGGDNLDLDSVAATPHNQQTTTDGVETATSNSIAGTGTLDDNNALLSRSFAAFNNDMGHLRSMKVMSTGRLVNQNVSRINRPIWSTDANNFLGS